MIDFKDRYKPTRPESIETRLIRESIEKKWELIAKGLSNDGGKTDCPLCQHFIALDCNFCPLQKQGEEFFCFTENGVYQEFLEYQKMAIKTITFSITAGVLINPHHIGLREFIRLELRKDKGMKAKAQEMVDMLETVYNLYCIKDVHDGIK